MAKAAPTSLDAPAINVKDTSPYWNDFTKKISALLWLPAETSAQDSDTSLANKPATETEKKSWFSIKTTQAASPKLPSIFSPASIRTLSDCTDSIATKKRSRKIRVYPDAEQRKTINRWFAAARWSYNQTIEILRQPDTTANWKKIKTPIIRDVPKRYLPAPYQVRSIAVRDACKAVSNAKIFNAQLKKDQAKGLRLEESFSEPGFRSRKHPHQNCFIPAKALFARGVYPKLLGNLKMAEPIPQQYGDTRLNLHNGRYHVCPSLPFQEETESKEKRGYDRVAAMDPGIRTFITWFSENSAGHIAPGAFGRIQRLCQHLDNLISNTTKAPTKDAATCGKQPEGCETASRT